MVTFRLLEEGVSFECIDCFSSEGRSPTVLCCQDHQTNKNLTLKKSGSSLLRNELPYEHYTEAMFNHIGTVELALK